MSQLPFAPFPSASVRQSILPQEWSVYLDSWTSLSDLSLRLNDKDFLSAVSEEGSLTAFLVSFFKALAEDPTLTHNVTNLRRRCFLLLHRVWSQDDIPESLLSFAFLSAIGYSFIKSEQVRVLLQSLWKRKGTQLEKALQPIKSSLIKSLDSRNPDDAEKVFNELGPLMKISLEAATFMLTGSDFIDSLNSAYPKTSSRLQSKLVSTAYLGLAGLLEGAKPNYSLLSDHLYSLKTAAEQEQKKSAGNNTLLASIATNTPLLDKIRESAPEGARIRNIAASLSTFRQSSIAKPKKLVRRKADKGKGKETADDHGHGAFGELHIHQMSLITQIQDLFPDLGSGFIAKLLDEYHDSIEEVTAHLLEDSLPPHLAVADRSEPLSSDRNGPRPHLSPRSTPPPFIPSRRNVFDNDDFDRLAVDTSRLHIGRKNEDLTADKMLSEQGGASSKSAILSALAAYDSDDDERDDTYDVEDVGGTIDSAVPGAEEGDADLRDKNEEALFRAYSVSPELFGRDGETRRGKPRAALKSETGMTDEAIEGWGIMIARDPKRLRRLEAKFSTFHGQQNDLASTAYRGNSTESGGEASGDGQRGGRGAFSGRGRNRGRGRGGGGRGGGVAGPADDKGTQVSRQRKEANKGSRANHNRRDQRARKMARGGLSG